MHNRKNDIRHFQKNGSIISPRAHKNSESIYNRQTYKKLLSIIQENRHFSRKCSRRNQIKNIIAKYLFPPLQLNNNFHSAFLIFGCDWKLIAQSRRKFIQIFISFPITRWLWKELGKSLRKSVGKWWWNWECRMSQLIRKHVFVILLLFNLKWSWACKLKALLTVAI